MVTTVYTYIYMPAGEFGGWGDAAFVSGIQGPVDAAAQGWGEGGGDVGGMGGVGGVGVTNEVSARYRDAVPPHTYTYQM